MFKKPDGGHSALRGIASVKGQLFELKDFGPSKAIERFAIVFIVVIVGVLIFAATRPDTFRVQRSASIKALPEEIFPLINDLHSMCTWWLWCKKSLSRTIAGMTFADHLFKRRHFDRLIITLCVRWYVRYKLSYHDLVEMMAERGLSLTVLSS